MWGGGGIRLIVGFLFYFFVGFYLGVNSLKSVIRGPGRSAHVHIFSWDGFDAGGFQPEGALKQGLKKMDKERQNTH